MKVRMRSLRPYTDAGSRLDATSAYPNDKGKLPQLCRGERYKQPSHIGCKCGNSTARFRHAPRRVTYRNAPPTTTISFSMSLRKNPLRAPAWAQVPPSKR